MDKINDDETEASKRKRRRSPRDRRRARGRTFANTNPSPCISVGQVDNALGCCIGCYRSIDEIREWPIMTAEEKLAALARVTERKAASGIARHD